VIATPAPAGSAVVGQTLDEVPTPALVLDLDRLERNLRSYQERVAALGKRFRPHAQGAQDARARAPPAGARGSRNRRGEDGEAEVFAEAGCRDVVVAYPVVGEEKWARLARLAAAARLAVDVDSEVGVRGLARAAEAECATIAVLVEVGRRSRALRARVDGSRRGIERLARLASTQPSLEFRGIAVYRAKSFAGALRLTNAEAGREEGRLVTDVAARLRERGLAVEEVVAGSTMTAWPWPRPPG